MTLHCRAWAVAIFSGVFYLTPALCQIPGLPEPAAPSAQKPVSDPLGRETPYGSVIGFLKAAERGQYSRAAGYLDTRRVKDGAALARQLEAILDAGGAAELESVSKAPDGNLADGLPANRERTGSIDLDDGPMDILLERVKRGGESIWLFSSETLDHIPRAVQEVGTDEIRRFVPRPLREIRIFSLPLYRWLATLVGICLALGFAALGSRLLFPLARPIVRRISHQNDDRLLEALRAPLWLILLACGIRALATLSLTVLGRQFWVHSAAALTIGGAGWLAIRLSNIVSESANRQLAQRQLTGKIALFTLLHRLFKIGVVLAGIVAIVYATGRDVTAILAGVGLGGIAIALAAQKTLEKLFGGMALISDEPIRVGDFCRFGGTMGTIEDIGLRSTRVRLLNRILLSIPNGQLSTMALENLTLRDKFLFSHKISLRYDTTPEQLRDVLVGIRELLWTNPIVDSEDRRVRLTQFGDSAFIFEVFAYLRVNDFLVFLQLQEELLLAILDIIVANGSGLAYPTQTMYLTRDRPANARAIEEATGRTRQTPRSVRARAEPASSGSPVAFPINSWEL